MLLALFQPDIPQNLGAALRLGACMGVSVHVIEPCGFPLSDKAIRRAAMDYGEPADVTRHPGWAEFHASRQGRIVLFSTKGATPLHDFSFRPDDILLFGRESVGVPDEVHEASDARVFIPLTAGRRSLNVTVSAAIGLSEALRQTGQFPKAAA
ncbi:MAG: tRNA (cytidine(34)-2'-O)-methyltransferase [Pseudomonadota bacterium]|uniref:tRNA (cytidine(34)-2'-O)-methyltransferase n=1 Tax=Phenylobacterium sp. TaxID=1871053 RepID=UPI0025FD4344|nr:tRNA (cytidine(34)-2'-O)-methyltransferase [Phenylobacterium sp.]MBT9471268.1 tRNA (cytidine(34)-2'-O)-methyltransferase [Phenylobacterium sp.]